MPDREARIRELLHKHNQTHLLAHWGQLGDLDKRALIDQIETIDFSLMNRLIAEWVLAEPPPASFESIAPVPTLPVVDSNNSTSRSAWQAGEEALRAGRVGLVLVAGGQGTRLGFEGPKGAYPIGPITGKTLFEYHAEKILGLQERYGCTLPWYIMVSNTNADDTVAFFGEHNYFGLGEENVFFFQQRMVPCVDDQGQFMLDAPNRIAMNPNGHGGSIPALVENLILEDARSRGIDTLSYFQVDNWAVKVADPAFLGYHVLGRGEMSSKVHRKTAPRDSVGVHCLCDGQYQVIEYTELDLYPQLLETDAQGGVKYYAGNPAIHILDVGFVQRVYENYDAFPWHRAHKKIPFLNEAGTLVKPDEPNGYKFETFVFDALQFTKHDPIALEIVAPGEYTPIKQFDGANSVVQARHTQRKYWGAWLEATGHTLPRGADGTVSVDLEISPQYGLFEDDFLAKADGKTWPVDKGLAINPEGEAITP